MGKKVKTVLEVGYHVVTLSECDKPNVTDGQWFEKIIKERKWHLKT